ncbi:unnamed protein product, partial [Mesorhabditis belari]|uniref:Uncharacterized protein n=1 Tax=Mesorhabditis belari TaxID=2138241 RepID=A0AAF3E8B4_9BILA
MALRAVICRRFSLSSSFIQILLGITVGYLVGWSLFGDSEFDIEAHLHKVDHHKDHKGQFATNFPSLRCVIIINSATPKRELFVQAIRETWGTECNETLFYTTESAHYYLSIPDLQERLIELSSSFNGFYWSLYHRILKDLRKTKYDWTLISDEKLFAVVSNLRRSLESIDSRKAVLVGRVSLYKYPLSSIFPFLESRRISHQAGIAISHSAIEMLASCNGFILPRATEKALLECANSHAITVIDPVDEENQHLFHSKDVLSLVPNDNEFSKMTNNKDVKMASCCSDHSITFGSMSFKEQRVAHFAATRIHVFGANGYKRALLNGTIQN